MGFMNSVGWVGVWFDLEVAVNESDCIIWCLCFGRFGRGERLDCAYVYIASDI